jgi:hypothetical protein
LSLRDGRWPKAIAVGSLAFVDRVKNDGAFGTGRNGRSVLRPYDGAEKSKLTQTPIYG